LSGWGAICGEITIWEAWNGSEPQDMAFLELNAVLRALVALPISWFRQSIHLRTDSVTAQAYINKMGGGIERLSILVSRIWSFLEQHEAFLVAFYIPTQENPADPFSRMATRRFHRFLDTELHLSPSIFSSACTHFHILPTIDWFASDDNHLLPRFCVFRFSQRACASDAFSLSWATEVSYLFPPFSLLNRVLRKIQLDRARGLLIHPRWPGAAWWPQVQSITKDVLRLGRIADVTSFPRFPRLVPNLPGLELQATLF
jgi:hypothetical protein